MISKLLDPMLDWAENLGKNRKGHIDWMVRFSTSMMIGSTTPQFPKPTNHMNDYTRPQKNKIIGLIGLTIWFTTFYIEPTWKKKEVGNT